MMLPKVIIGSCQGGIVIREVTRIKVYPRNLITLEYFFKSILLANRTKASPVVIPIISTPRIPHGLARLSIPFNA